MVELISKFLARVDKESFSFLGIDSHLHGNDVEEDFGYFGTYHFNTNLLYFFKSLHDQYFISISHHTQIVIPTQVGILTFQPKVEICFDVPEF